VFVGCQQLKEIFVPIGSKRRFTGLLPSINGNIIIELPNLNNH